MIIDCDSAVFEEITSYFGCFYCDLLVWVTFGIGSGWKFRFWAGNAIEFRTTF